MTERNESHINQVYSYLIDQLKLSDKHIKKLEHRGFSIDQIELLQYKTFPNKRSNLVDKLASQFELEGVPGFWQNTNGKWQLAGKAGLLIPVRNNNGTVTSIKVRIDGKTAAGKYIHISSNPKSDKNGKVKYPKGTVSKVAVHYPIKKSKTETIRITEGEIKADLSTLISGIYTISIPGINMWQWALPAVNLIKPKKILLAFDSDKDKEFSTSKSPATKPFEVKKALANLYMTLVEKGYNVVIEDWDESSGKGIDDVLADGFSDRIKEMTAKEAQQFVTDALKDDMPLDWVYVIGTKRFVHSTTLQELDKEQFSDKYAPDFKDKRAATKVLKHPGFPKVDLPIYEPARELIIEQDTLKYFNFWRPCKIKPIKGTVKPFLNHLEYLLPNPVEMNILLDYLAYIVQNPGKKVHWAVMLQGVAGTGKSYLGAVMRDCLGDSNVSNPSNEAIHEDYTEWQKSCQLIIIEELMSRGRLELMNKFKPMITQPIAVIREMYKASYEQPNRFNFLIFTNHKDAIIIDETDRRYCVLYSNAEPKEPSYYEMLFDWTSSNPGKILNWFMERDLSSFKPYAHAPMTKSKRELVQDGLSPLQRWVTDGIELENWPFHSDILSIEHLIACLPNYLKNVHPNAINKELKKAGARELKQVKLSSGNYARLMTIRRHEIWTNANDTKLVNQYEKWAMSKEPGNNPLLDAKPI